MEGVGQGYVAPVVRDYGDLVALTQADPTMVHVGVGAVNGASTPVGPGGGGSAGARAIPDSSTGATLPATGNSGGGSTTGGGNPAAGTLGANGVGGSGGGSGGGGGGSGAGSGGGGGSSLPFTGFTVGLLGAVGAGMSAAGVALRRRLSRGQSPR